ncbi:unnamed protein product [Calicophoron daubneyi]|uniref:Integrator complex subunit 7 n=1 Tax=Calicophoron daubneyi TaxID=300641 RepID=A0AAV2T2Y3_CALDB
MPCLEPNEYDLGKDANALIMELNKGLQSISLGEQCKAIAQFPDLLEKYPFPVVVNSIFLKITQVFCDSNNYIRLCILRACNECRPHLGKLTVCDDIVRKLMPFTASNDPTARALTLRLFGTLSRITREHTGVHHAILKQIESHYEVESDAAIWASHQLAPMSSAFAVSLCPILCNLLDELSTDSDVKIKLLRLGKHMYHDVQIAEQMRHCLTNLLSVYSTSEFVVNILTTLTLLASRAPIHSSGQLDLLIGQFSKDDRPSVCQSVLKNLCLLSQLVPHQWKKTHIAGLCSLYESPSRTALEKEDILHILCHLSDSCAAADLFYSASGNSEDWNLAGCLRNALLTFPASRLTVKAMQLACRLAILLARSEETVRLTPGVEPTDEKLSRSALSPAHLICLLVAQFSVPKTNADATSDTQPIPWFLAPDGIPMNELKCTYSLLAKFFDTFPEYTANVREMGLFEHVRLDGAERVGLLCQFLGTVISRLPKFSLLSYHSSNGDSSDYSTLLSHLSSVQVKQAKPSEPKCPSILPVCGLVFQLRGNRFLTPKEQKALLMSVGNCVSAKEDVDSRASPNPRLPVWMAYQIARQASRYGQHTFAARIYEKLTSVTLTERSNYWVRGLAQFSQALADLVQVADRVDRNLENDWATPPPNPNERAKPQPLIATLIDGFQRAADTAIKARTLFICVGGPDICWFQAEYVGIFSDLFICLAELCTNAYNYSRLGRWSKKSTSLYSVTQSSTTSSSSDPQPSPIPFWIVSQMEMWSLLSDRIHTLQMQCLDADSVTHQHLSAIHQLVCFFREVLTSISEKYRSLRPETSGEHAAELHEPMRDPYADILPKLRGLVGSQVSNLDWLVRLTLLVGQVSPHWPRFMFQRLQTTTVRLVLFPRAGSSPDDVLTITGEVGHMVQVMGVVQQRSRLPKGYIARRITVVEVELTVTEFNPEKYGQMSSFSFGTGSSNVIFCTRRSAQLHCDYFHCEFCVQFPTTNSTASNTQRPTDKIYSVRAVPILLDSSGNSWRPTRASGAPEETALVRVESSRGNVDLAATESLLTATNHSNDPSEVIPQANPRTTEAPTTDTNRSALDTQFGITKPRPIGRLSENTHSGVRVRPARAGAVSSGHAPSFPG